MSEKREKELITSFIRAFGKYGLDGTTAKKLAEEAGISPGGLYVYYKSKEEIILCCVQTHLKEVREVTASLFKEYGSQLDTVAYKLFDYLKGTILESRFLMQVLAHPYYSTLVKVLRQEHLFSIAQLPAEMRGSLSEKDCQAIILLCNSALNNYVMTQDEKSCFIQLEYILKILTGHGKDNHSSSTQRNLSAL